jgi:hypothetical protein
MSATRVERRPNRMNNASSKARPEGSRSTFELEEEAHTGFEPVPPP